MAGTRLFKSTLNGFFFGIALTYSGLQTLISNTNDQSSPSSSRITYDMTIFILTLYLCTFATSASAIYFSDQLGLTNLSPRKPSNYGWFKFDGNIVGGLMQGVGMIVVRSEPGLTFVSVGQGHTGAVWTMLGGMLGGVAFVILNERLKRVSLTKVTSEGAKNASYFHSDSISETKAGWMLLGLEVVVISVVLLLRLETSDVDAGTSGLSWTQAIVGGVLIGSAQIVSLVLTRGTLGVSSAYPTLANHSFRIFDSSRADPGFSSLFFALGVVLSGSLSRLLDDGDIMALEPSVNWKSSLVGGCLLILGARLAGGCTSGHGISGCGLLSFSSAVTVLSMATGALLFSHFRF